MAPGESIRIVLADDHQIVRRGLQLILDLEPGFSVVGQGSDIASARALVRECQPDVLVLDLHMPGGSVFQAIPMFRRESPNTQIVVLTMEADAASVQATRQAGALGYVVKEAADSELADAVRRAAAGQTYINRRMAGELAVHLMRAEACD